MGNQLPLPVPSIHSGSSILLHLRHDVTLLSMLVLVGEEVLVVVPLSALLLMKAQHQQGERNQEHLHVDSGCFEETDNGALVFGYLIRGEISSECYRDQWGVSN